MSSASPLELPARPAARAWIYWSVFSLFILGFFAMAIDMPVARFVAADHLPGDLSKIFHLSEVFAHGVGIAGILITIAVLDPGKRWALPRVICMFLCTGLLCNLMKLVVERNRPRAFDLSQHVYDSFAGFLPLTSAGSGGQSVPSAHTASAVALAVGLCWLYPRGKYLWITLAALASMQRIDSLAHFPSDVVWGTAFGLLIGLGILHGWLSNPWLDRLEGHLYRRRINGDEASATSNIPQSDVAKYRVDPLQPMHKAIRLSPSDIDEHEAA